MKRILPILVFILCASFSRAQVPMDPRIVGAAANHELSWNTSLNYFYHVECSLDLQTWI